MAGPQSAENDMTEHYTKSTVEASVWCRVCGKNTMHRIDNGIVGPCRQCLTRPPAPKKKPKPVQLPMFDYTEDP